MTKMPPDDTAPRFQLDFRTQFDAMHYVWIGVYSMAGYQFAWAWYKKPARKEILRFKLRAWCGILEKMGETTTCE